MKKRRLYLLGDIHAQFDWLAFVLKAEQLHNSYIIQLGDFGLGFSEREQNQLDLINEMCFRYGVELLVIRGNHDNPKPFKESIYNFSNLKFIPDYTVLKINGLKIFFLGGGTSVDRTMRKENISWWKDEVIDFDKNRLSKVLQEYQYIDVVVTHSAPDIAPPYVYGRIVDEFRLIDKSLLWDIEHERAGLRKLFQRLSPPGVRTWLYGHFHIRDENIVDNTRFVAIGINEFVELHTDFNITRISDSDLDQSI